jgi:hypothetical protein
MRQPAPSILVLVLFVGVPFLAACIGPFINNLLFAPDFSVRFVLPNDYVGEFKVVLDSANGEAYGFDGREFVFRVPENGMLRVTSDAPLNSFDRQIAVYEDDREVGLVPLASDATIYRYRVERPGE